ncbi:hypothetical protein GCM10010377_35740 [Streptomyces viridiviolaceus]|nr:hypothetical protein GCM10010377_35740 [Streptomyces viridiviolaceus]
MSALSRAASRSKERGRPRALAGRPRVSVADRAGAPPRSVSSLLTMGFIL